MNQTIDRYNELKELAEKVKDSTYLSTAELFSGFKYVDDVLFNTWKIQVKSFIEDQFGESSIFFKEFEKAEIAKGLATNKSIFEKLLAIFNSLEYELNKTNQIKSKTKTNTNNRQVFIVHGHDEQLKTEVELFLKNLDLEPIILHKQANMGKTIIEKIEHYTDVGFGIVLYTPCDEGKGKKESEYKNRARQNVVFEHGYLIGKLGREKVSFITKGKIETPGDISGVVYNSESNHWHFDLAKELKAANYNIDMNKLL